MDELIQVLEDKPNLGGGMKSAISAANYAETEAHLMANNRYDPEGLIRILGSKNLANPGTWLYAGYSALTEMEGRRCSEFRDLVGPKPGRPYRVDRPFSPSDTIRHAIREDYAELVSTTNVG